MRVFKARTIHHNLARRLRLAACVDGDHGAHQLCRLDTALVEKRNCAAPVAEKRPGLHVGQGGRVERHPLRAVGLDRVVEAVCLVEREDGVPRAERDRPPAFGGTAGPRDQRLRRAARPEQKRQQVDVHPIEHEDVPRVGHDKVVRRQRRRQAGPGHRTHLAHSVQGRPNSPRPAHHRAAPHVVPRVGGECLTVPEQPVDSFQPGHHGSDAAGNRAAKGLVPLKVQGERLHSDRKASLPQRVRAASPGLNVCVGHVFHRQPAHCCQQAGRLSAKCVAEEDRVGFALRLKLRRAHEPGAEMRSATLAVDTEAAQQAVTIQHVLEALATAFKVARAVAEQGSAQRTRDGSLNIVDLVVALAASQPGVFPLLENLFVPLVRGRADRRRISWDRHTDGLIDERACDKACTVRAEGLSCWMVADAATADEHMRDHERGQEHLDGHPWSDTRPRGYHSRG
eukprot:scaffold33845_cov101-Isochrysis_galbana.AAC.4